MQISKASLEKALAMVKPGLSSKELVEQSTSFAFVGGVVITYNDEISLASPIEGLDIEGAIKADELFAFMKKVKKDEIDVSLEGSEIHFKAGRIKAGFTLQEEIKIPMVAVDDSLKWKKLPDDFCHYLNLAMGAAGSDMSEPLLTGVNIEKDGGITASDNYKVMMCDTGQELPVKTFLIPAKNASEVVRLDPHRIASGKGWIHFEDKEGTVLSCRIFEEAYPKSKKKIEVIGVELSFPPTIIEIMERAGIFSKREHILDEAVQIFIANNRMKIRAESPTGWMEETVNLRYDEEEIHFTITPYLLRDILKETTAFTLGEKALKFEGAGWVYVSALRNNPA